jgi:hypothetical protein
MFLCDSSGVGRNRRWRNNGDSRRRQRQCGEQSRHICCQQVFICNLMDNQYNGYLRWGVIVVVTHLDIGAPWHLIPTGIIIVEITPKTGLGLKGGAIIITCGRDGFSTVHML